MALMCRLRQTRQSSQLLPEYSVIRTIQAPHHLMLVTDASGEWVLSSAAYSPSRDGFVSVDLEQLLIEDGLNAKFMYPAVNRSVAAATHTVSALQELNLAAVHDPIAKNWYHGGISGIDRSNRGREIRRQLAKTASFLIPIDQIEAQKFHDDADANGRSDIQSS
ncbi:hypothetical protein ACOSOMT5_P0837 [Acidiphilium sp. MT5]